MPAQHSHHNAPAPEDGIADRTLPLRAHGRAQLAAAAIAVAIIWLLILPAIGRWSPVAARIERHQAQGIDPSVKFYSELEAMPSILQHLDQIRRRDAALFWEPSRRDRGIGGSGAPPLTWFMQL